MKRRVAVWGIVALGAVGLALLASSRPEKGKSDVPLPSDNKLVNAPHPTNGAQSRVLDVRRSHRDGGASGDTAEGKVFANAPWGGGPGQLGRHQPTEANPQAPMSLAMDPSGNAVVLDQVNGRLSRFDKNGQPLPQIPLTVQGAQDVAIGKDGTYAVLDRLIDKTVAVVGPDGKLLGELPVGGKNITHPGGVTGVFVDGSDVYVEKAHSQVIRIGDTAGKPDLSQPVIPGRPSRDGLSYLNAGLLKAAAGQLYVSATDRKTGAHRFTRELSVRSHIYHLMLLDSDQAGVIYLALMADQEGGSPQTPSPRVLLLCLEPTQGTLMGETEMPANIAADETFRELTVLDEGGVLYLQRTEQGTQLTQHDCRTRP